MRVLFHTTYASATARAVAGETLDLPDDLADQIISGGYGSHVDDPEPRRRLPPDGDEPPSPPPMVGSGSSRAAWAEYATAIGIDIADGDNKKTIVAQVKAALSEQE